MLYIIRKVVYEKGSIAFQVISGGCSLTVEIAGTIVHTQGINITLENVQMIDIFIAENRERFQLGVLQDDYIKVAHFGINDDIFTIRKNGFNIDLLYSPSRNVFKQSTYAINYSNVQGIVALCANLVYLAHATVEENASIRK